MRALFFIALIALPVLIAIFIYQLPTNGGSSDLDKNKGMTWAAQAPTNGNIWLECYARSSKVGAELVKCDPYVGDTECSAERPVLCINKKNVPQPQETIDSQEKYNREWSGAEVKLTEPVKGTELISKEAGDTICTKKFGNDWKMAEFHDGKEWGFWAKGEIDVASRFWVSISDQAANCWDKRP